MFKDWLRAMRNKYAAFAAKCTMALVTIHIRTRKVVDVATNATVIMSYLLALWEYV